MADGDIVRKITISATGENLDATKKAIDGLSAATSQLTSATSEFANKEAFTDKLAKWAVAIGALTGVAYVAKSAFQALYDVLAGVVDITVAATVATVSLGVSLLPDKIRVYTFSWESTNEQLRSYIVLAGKAGALGVSTDFYQRQIGAAETLKITNDSIIKQMDTLRDATKGNLGGSTGQKRVDELVSFGNFKGNSGVDELKNATTAEEKYTAVLSLIEQAQDAGERFAAIDVAKTLLGKDAADNLQADADYFDKMRVAGQKLETTNLISNEDTSRALDLANRLALAEETINKKWFPGQRDGLNPLVMIFKELWVDIVELVAGAFTWVEKIVKSMLSIPTDLLNKFRDWKNGGSQNVESPDRILTPQEQANNTMRTGLLNPNTVSQAGKQTQNLADQLRPDKSFSAKPVVPDATDTASYDRAVESLRKYIETTNAASLSIDATADAQERLKAVAQLVAAGMKDGLTREVATLRANMNGLTTDAGNAALALAKARVESQIKFGRNTSLLSPEDVQIASQLKSIYPDVATALGSVQATAIRTNTALSSLSGMLSGTLTTGLTDILDGTKSVKNGFADMSKIIVRAIEEMIVKLLIVGPLMRALQGGLGGIFGGGELPGYGTSSFIGPLPGHAAGTDSSPGGWHVIGENGPELMNVPKGAQILPNGVSPSGGTFNVTVPVNIDATGADAAGLARVQQQLASLQATLPTTIVQTVQKARSNRML